MYIFVTTFVATHTSLFMSGIIIGGLAGALLAFAFDEPYQAPPRPIISPTLLHPAPTYNHIAPRSAAVPMIRQPVELMLNQLDRAGRLLTEPPARELVKVEPVYVSEVIDAQVLGAPSEPSFAHEFLMAGERRRLGGRR